MSGAPTVEQIPGGLNCWVAQSSTVTQTANSFAVQAEMTATIRTSASRTFIWSILIQHDACILVLLARTRSLLKLAS